MKSHLTSPPSTTLPLKHILLFLFYKVGSVLSSIPSQLRMSKCDITQSHPYENRGDYERGNTRGAAASAVQEITNARFPFPEWNVNTYIAKFTVSATHAHPHWNTRHEQTKYEEGLGLCENGATTFAHPAVHGPHPLLLHMYPNLRQLRQTLSLPRYTKPAMLIMVVMMSTPS